MIGVIFIMTFLYGHDTEYRHQHQYSSYLKQHQRWIKSIQKHNEFNDNERSYRYWRHRYEEVMLDITPLHDEYKKLIGEHNMLNYAYKELRKENTRLRLVIKRFECE